ncbi:unsaturated glucuronyl hydrolase-like [Bradysia coprophila]|uniref:unsaturated glucuronyl hydrolase-like n=1 Tax=Bradysia coprophila TaxID=38358 RepID=UPI00187DBD16|nr:unsaturated glucuronyl hydrolase-like [Bradysia coprophila]
MKPLSLLLFFFFVIANSIVLCNSFDVHEALSYAIRQYGLLAHNLEDDDRFIYTGNPTNSEWDKSTDSSSWTVGFYTGTLWKLYKLTNDKYWMEQALHKQETIRHRQFDESNHDVGFIIMSSFGYALTLTGDRSFEEVIIQAADSLATRYNSVCGVFRSWNNGEWNGGADGDLLVIADNMMNLDLMFTATELSGNQSYAQMAISHSEKTFENHFRENGQGVFHVVAYNENTGAVRRKYNYQGYADDSTWARGLAWVVHGYATTYDHTKNPSFLEYAEKAAEYFVDNLPADWVPYYDFDCPYTDMYQPRDTSAAAITAHALLKLYRSTNKIKYFQQAESILEALFSPSYRADGRSSYKLPAILANGTVHFNAGNFDTAIIYGDMYFLEAIDLYMYTGSGYKNVLFVNTLGLTFLQLFMNLFRK